MAGNLVSDLFFVWSMVGAQQTLVTVNKVNARHHGYRVGSALRELKFVWGNRQTTNYQVVKLSECYGKGYPEVLRRSTEDVLNSGGWGMERVFSGGNDAS